MSNSDSRVPFLEDEVNDFVEGLQQYMEGLQQYMSKKFERVFGNEQGKAPDEVVVQQIIEYDAEGRPLRPHFRIEIR